VNYRRCEPPGMGAVATSISAGFTDASNGKPRAI
jgi:hypothetical protein